MLSSSGETSIALPAAKVMQQSGIDVIFASWLTESCRYLYDHGYPDALYIPRLLPPERAYSLQELDALDRRYSPPGLGQIHFAEVQGRYLREDQDILPLVLRYLAFWEQFLTEQQITAVVLWTSSSIACRAMWLVARALDIPHLVLGSGPSYDYFSIADINEEAIWSELVQATAANGPKVLTPQQKQEVLDLIAGVTAVNSSFTPRGASVIPLTIRRLIYKWRRARSRRNMPPAVPTWQPSPESMARYPDDPQEIQMLEHIRSIVMRQRLRWAWLMKLGILHYSQPNYNQPYVYFPMQFQRGTRLLGHSPFYSDQVTLAKMIARCVPPGYKLYVKEHPTHPGSYDWRSLRELEQLPNVELIHPYSDKTRIIREAKVVIAVSSTAGWESFLWKIPVVALGRTFYTCSDLVFCANCFDEVSAKLRQAIDAGAQMYDERADEWLWFIWQTMQTAYPGSVFGYKDLFGTLKAKDADTNGALVGQGITRKLLRMSEQSPDVIKTL